MMVEGEWLNGVPHGVCIIENEESKGIITFSQGKHCGPQWFDSKVPGNRYTLEC